MLPQGDCNFKDIKYNQRPGLGFSVLSVMLSYDCAICNDPLAGATRCLQSGDARQETCSGKSMRID